MNSQADTFGKHNGMDPEQTKVAVKDYYGKVLSSKYDLRTTACCSSDAYTPAIREIVGMLHTEVLEKSYGCGIPIPEATQGCQILDLGCGAGRDVFILSKLVGAEGFVFGVDMTEEQLAVAKKHEQTHIDSFGYSKSNIRFQQGYMEDLRELGFKDESLDIAISNCVFNLSPAKESLFREILRVLKPGGELYFSDVFCDRRLSPECQKDPLLLGECLGGALYFEDFRRLLRKLGVEDFRIVKSSPITITDEIVKRKVGEAQFTSVTVRVFKLELEDQCEDYGQAVCYKGSIIGHPHAFDLDDHHHFETGRIVTVCRNTASMLKNTRFSAHFEHLGDDKVHYGLFPCAPSDFSDQSVFGSCC